jgi:hypothetical protein
MRIAIKSLPTVGLGVLFCLGFWLGAFEWFGGYEQRQEFFQFMGLVLSICMLFVLRMLKKSSWLVVIGYFVLSQLVFAVGCAGGQTYYCSPTNAKDSFETFCLALQNKL